MQTAHHCAEDDSRLLQGSSVNSIGGG